MRHIHRNGIPLVLISLVIIGLVAEYLLISSYFKRISPVKYTLPPPAIPTTTPPPPTFTLAPTPTSLPTKKPTPKIQSILAFVTYYGWPDNGPSPGNGIAYPHSRHPETIHENAGGTGTYADPLTFASATDQFSIGDRIYLPYLQKYAIKEDLCASCGANHVDIWMESDAAYSSELDRCQGNFTRTSETVEVNPPPGRPINATPLFNKANGACLK